MPQITFGETQLSCPSDVPLLDSLLKANQQIPFGCRQGICQSCLLCSLDTKPPTAAQIGLKDTLQQQNYFLACLCLPKQDMTIQLPDQQGQKINATVISKHGLAADIVGLTLQTETPFAFYAGQFVNLERGDGLTRSYSIANPANSQHQIEFHIRRLPNGRFSNWVHDQLAIGDTLTLSAPQGHCHYLPQHLEQPLLLIGTGTGLAPLLGILKDALNNAHKGPIELFHGSRNADGLYLQNELQQLSAQHPNFRYTACLSGEPCGGDYVPGRAHEIALATKTNLKGWRIYLCGHPDMVKHSQKMAYIKGASLKDIYADAFVVGTG